MLVGCPEDSVSRKDMWGGREAYLYDLGSAGLMNVGGEVGGM